jgi:hypothetical protein
VSCAAGSTCTQYARYYTKDNVNNTSSTYSKTVRQDKQAPTDGTLIATPGDTQVSLSWTAASDSGSGLATSNTYKLVFSTSGSPAANCTSDTQIYLDTGSSYNHTGLTNGITYYYRVCAYDVVSNISTGASASGVPVGACYDNGATCSTNSQCCSSKCYRDADSDGYAATSGTKTCKSSSSSGTDCCDTDSRVHPGQSSYYTSANNCGDWDYNCSGAVEQINCFGYTQCQYTFPINMNCVGACSTETLVYGSCTPVTPITEPYCADSWVEASCPSITCYPEINCTGNQYTKYQCKGTSRTCSCH